MAIKRTTGCSEKRPLPYRKQHPLTDQLEFGSGRGLCVVPRTSLFWPLSPRTCDGSPNLVDPAATHWRACIA